MFNKVELLIDLFLSDGEVADRTPLEIFLQQNPELETKDVD